MWVTGRFPTKAPDAPEWAVELYTFLKKWVERATRALNGNLGYGDGTNPDNMLGCWVVVADTGTADTEFAVAHTLGTVPVGFHVMIPPTGGFVYKGTTAWTKSNIYLKCSAANKAVTLFILGSSVAFQS